jgi:hypothetical protein
VCQEQEQKGNDIEEGSEEQDGATKQTAHTKFEK